MPLLYTNHRFHAKNLYCHFLFSISKENIRSYNSSIYRSEDENKQGKFFPVIQWNNFSKKLRSCYAENERNYENEREWSLFSERKYISYLMCCQDEENDLWKKCNPCWSNEGIFWNDDDIPDYIYKSNHSIDSEHFCLLSSCDHDIGREWWDEVDEKYPCDDLHGITACIEWERIFQIFFSCDEMENLSVKCEECTRNSNTKKYKNLVSAKSDIFDGGSVIFCECSCQYWKETIQEYCPIHHPDFDNLHRHRIECYRDVCLVARLENREEYNIYLEEYNPKKKRDTIWKGSTDNMTNIFTIPLESYMDEFSTIEIRQSCHEYISEKSRNTGENNLLIAWNIREYYACRKCYDDEKCEKLAESIGYKRKLSTENCLKIAHEWALNESEKREECDYSDRNKCRSIIVSWEKEGNCNGKKNNSYTHECSEGEDGIRHFFPLLLIICSWYFSHGDRIESEISNHREYREIVVYLRVDSIITNIEVPREKSDKSDRYDSSDELASDLCKGVGIYLFRRHGREYRELPRKIQEKNRERIL